VTKLVYGVLTWQKRLDWTLAALARRPVSELDPPVRAALRLGLFQLRMLERVPSFAAIDTSVELVKRLAGVGASKLVNAVLRSAERTGETPLPPDGEDPVTRLAVEWSHPEWLVRLWLEELGPERTLALLRANDLPAPTTARVDLHQLSRERAVQELAALGVVARPGAYAPGAIVIESPISRIAGLPWLTLQSEASQLVALLVGAGGDERILDACAAPGGKSLALLDAPGASIPRLFAGDRSLGGMRRVRAHAGRARRRIGTFVGDASRPPFAAGTFDAVLIDAPCSGLGTLRSHPEIRWRRTRDEIPELAAAQAAMLRAVAPLVRPGGRLVYSTCTLVVAENADLVSAFLIDHPEFCRDDARPHLPVAARELVDDDGSLRTSPERGGLDGFFAVRLSRAPA
jgi:16S rRNA (cytosine967-C5)-methyltransferase